MNGSGATPIFVDTGAFYARADEDDEHHHLATHVFSGIQSGEIPLRPIYTSQSVLSELATLLLYKVGHTVAVRALTAVFESESINIISVGKPAFEATTDQFKTYSDQQISFVDHTSSILADEFDIDHIFAFDSDFRTLGFSLVPDDVNISLE